MSPKQALKAVKDHFGSGSELARKLAISPAAVNQWRCVPIKRVKQIERLSGGTFSRYDLRPDVFEREAA